MFIQPDNLQYKPLQI